MHYLVLIFFDFCGFISVAYTTLNKLLAVFIYNIYIGYTFKLYTVFFRNFSTTKCFQRQIGGGTGFLVSEPFLSAMYRCHLR